MLYHVQLIFDSCIVIFILKSIERVYAIQHTNNTFTLLALCEDVHCYVSIDWSYFIMQYLDIETNKHTKIAHVGTVYNLHVKE